MLEIGPQHPLDYRREILSRLFGYVQSAESFYVIGAASMGKTRLLDFLMRSEVQEHYLHEKAEKYWLVRVDLNRLAIKGESWAFYELLLSSLLLDLNNHKNTEKFRVDIALLDSEVIQKRDLLLALRFFELAVNKLCQDSDLRLCFLLDEFDETYHDLPHETFKQLRAVRDANKNRVSFGLFLRNPPERLHSTRDNEGFYELLSRNRIGLTPYTRLDALGMIQQLEERRNHPLTSELRKKIFDATGGHPGMISAIMSILVDVPNSHNNMEAPGWIEWLSRQGMIVEECRKIWEGVSKEEQEGLSAFAKGDSSKIALAVERLLLIKGLLNNEEGRVQLFSHLFMQYARSQRP